MRVSSSAPALSRRSIMKGLAAALLGASMPVAAVAGYTASRLTTDDSELLSRCQIWKEKGRKLKRMEKRLNVYATVARTKSPEKAIKRAWALHDRLERQYDREVSRRNDVLLQILRMKARTLKGAMAQLEIVEADPFLLDGYHEQANDALMGVVRNVRRLAAALPVEA